MPVYEYQCADCEHISQYTRKVDERDDEAICEKCTSVNTVRKLSVSSFSLKGGGWAADGYSKGS